MQDGPVICRECGRRVDRGVSYCDGCGASVPTATRPTATGPTATGPTAADAPVAGASSISAPVGTSAASKNEPEPKPTSPTAATAAGAEPEGTPAEGYWAPDPYGRARLRWWDGTHWTQFVHG